MVFNVASTPEKKPEEARRYRDDAEHCPELNSAADHRYIWALRVVVNRHPCANEIGSRCHLSVAAKAKSTGAVGAASDLILVGVGRLLVLHRNDTRTRVVKPIRAERGIARTNYSAFGSGPLVTSQPESDEVPGSKQEPKPEAFKSQKHDDGERAHVAA